MLFISLLSWPVAPDCSECHSILAWASKPQAFGRSGKCDDAMLHVFKRIYRGLISRAEGRRRTATPDENESFKKRRGQSREIRADYSRASELASSSPRNVFIATFNFFHSLQCRGMLLGYFARVESLREKRGARYRLGKM